GCLVHQAVQARCRLWQRSTSQRPVPPARTCIPTYPMPSLQRMPPYGYSSRSFLEANIFTLKKQARPASRLDLRPLALLNTDYKVKTRIIAKRIRPLLPKRIHEHQT
ncbi:TPA: hypothetical protein N0F65_004035, partial [Lagenidium giganteum]